MQNIRPYTSPESTSSGGALVASAGSSGIFHAPVSAMLSRGILI
jgi:hypothetical protein